jgi:hypothetical protein
MAEFKFEGTAAEVQEAKRILEEAGLLNPLKVGDYVVADKGANPYFRTNAEKMKLGVVTEVDEDCPSDIMIKVLEWHEGFEVYQTHNGPYDVNARYFRKATADEMPDPRKLAFKAAGREMNEFKKGDIVRANSGKLYEIIEVEPPVLLSKEHGVTVGATTESEWKFKINVDLVAPVESRVDKHD